MADTQATQFFFLGRESEAPVSLHEGATITSKWMDAINAGGTSKVVLVGQPHTVNQHEAIRRAARGANLTLTFGAKRGEVMEAPKSGRGKPKKVRQDFLVVTMTPRGSKSDEAAL